MAEYLANAVQTVNLNEPIIFTASIPCSCGCIYHADETGIFILRSPNGQQMRYQVTFNGNIAVPTGSTVGAIAVGIVENGELRPTSRAISTPTAVEVYSNVTSTAIITVPGGCCFNIAIEAVSGITAPATDVAAPQILVQNANVVITKVS